MAHTMNDEVLIEAWGVKGAGIQAKRAAMVVLGVAALTLAAKIRVPMWPVPVTMQTFAVLTIGATFGARLGGITLFAYLALGAVLAGVAQMTTGEAGWTVFTGEAADLAYFAGPTAGYLLGFLLAAVAMGALARQGWDRSVPKMVGALLIGNAIIYVCGMPWMAYLFLESKGAAWVFQWGMGNFLIGDLVKLALAAMIVPMLWKVLPRD